MARVARSSMEKYITDPLGRQTHCEFCERGHEESIFIQRQLLLFRTVSLWEYMSNVQHDSMKKGENLSHGRVREEEKSSRILCMRIINRIIKV